MTSNDKKPDASCPDAYWKEKLSSEEYRITRQKGTERAFTGKYWNHDEKGIYRCTCCGEELFVSDSKFEAGCGWPSFTEPASSGRVEEHEDLSHGMTRREVVCQRCGAHLGHVFDDGPGPTHQRYCINSASLKFDRKDPTSGRK